MTLLKRFACAASAAAIAVAGCVAVKNAKAPVPNPLPDLRFMSYNVMHCEGKEKKFDLAPIAEAIMREKPDFAGINEIHSKTRRTGNVDQPAELGRLTGLHATFGQAIPYQGGGYGVAVLSREKPVSVERVPLPGKEKRLLLLCEFANFWFGTTHLDFGTNQLKSVEIIRGVVAEKSATKPVFLTGDWNATPESATLAAMKAPMNGVAPFTASRAIRRKANTASTTLRSIPDMRRKWL